VKSSKSVKSAESAFQENADFTLPALSERSESKGRSEAEIPSEVEGSNAEGHNP